MFSNQPTVSLWRKSACDDHPLDHLILRAGEASTSALIVLGVNDPYVGSRMSAGKWLIPLNFNQGLFDMMQWQNNGTLLVVKVTDAEKNEYEMAALIPWVNALRCSKVELVIICRHHNFDAYHIEYSHFTSISKLNDALKANYSSQTATLEPFNWRKTCVVTYQERVSV